MRQVLFHIPLHSLRDGLPDIPIYGYGAMLFVAFVFCTWLASRLARREGIEPKHVQDLAIWIFLFGIVGARITYMIQNYKDFTSLWQFFRIWDGGLVFYGSAIGGVVGYFVAYVFVLRKHHISSWKMADIIAPCAALGLCLGRVGCLLNGCCYGNVACPECPAVSFPMCSPPRFAMTMRGYQSAAGFVLDPKRSRTVAAVEPGSAAERAGLRAGDEIRKVNDDDVGSLYEIADDLGPRKWERGKTDLKITVRHANGKDEDLTFTPRTIGLHPTQIYESISMGLLFFLLLSYYPFKRHDGVIMVMLMLAYAVHRFLNEMLRTDTEPVAFNMTLSQNVSIMVFAAGVVLGLSVLRKPRLPHSEVAAPASTGTA
jgi:phosphatidylglycerol:prolipoprotein diacylglycerol transferase